MSARIPAGDKGTADRIEADDGGYWVRLVTRQALLREGECMQNCLGKEAFGPGIVGDERMTSDAIWSLRNCNGLSKAVAEIKVITYVPATYLYDMKGPRNTPVYDWSMRQVRHLVAAFKKDGVDLLVPPDLFEPEPVLKVWSRQELVDALRRESARG